MIFNFLNRELNIKPDNPAVISSECNITYNELNNLINKTASVLSTRYNISEGMHTAILSDNNSDFIVLILALWRLNAVPVPLNVRLLDNGLLKLIEHSQSQVVFVHKNYNDRLKDSPNTILFPIEDLIAGSEIDANRIDDNSHALIMYTSGTTGIPKGVPLSYSNILYSAESTIDLIKQTYNDRWLASLPFYHIGGLQVITRAVLKGSSIIIPKSPGTDYIIEALDAFKPTLASLVTTTLRRIIELKIKPNPEMRYVFLGGGPIETELVIKASELGWNIVKVYGSTETSSMITALKCEDHKAIIESAGKAFKGCSVKIVDDHGNELPPLFKGEILVSGRNVMTGYWRNEDENNRKIENNFYYTGDIGYLDDDGYLYINARRTDLIISGGENINPFEVETEMINVPGIIDVCVFPIADPEWGQIAAATIVLEKESTLTEMTIKETLKDIIASYKIPKRWFFVETLPRNELGKINRDEIRMKFE